MTILYSGFLDKIYKRSNNNSFMIDILILRSKMYNLIKEDENALISIIQADKKIK